MFQHVSWNSGKTVCNFGNRAIKGGSRGQTRRLVIKSIHYTRRRVVDRHTVVDHAKCLLHTVIRSPLNAAHLFGMFTAGAMNRIY